MSPYTEPFVVLEKVVGETPLACVERWRVNQPNLEGIPLAYAGRLDPMASGKLLVLIGEECKRQSEYHGLDKEYEFSILFGVHSDSGDVLGVIREHEIPSIPLKQLNTILANLIGPITLPYPAFSSRTVHGKPLHTWAVEGRLSEIEIPHKTSQIYTVTSHKPLLYEREALHDLALTKINTLPPVTDPRKALGNDFRRPAVRASWERFRATGSPKDQFVVVPLTCTASSGTYMRSLAEEIARQLGSRGLAFSIHRTKIGTYDSARQTWQKLY